jgi:hypothetical protein
VELLLHDEQSRVKRNDADSGTTQWVIAITLDIGRGRIRIVGARRGDDRRTKGMRHSNLEEAGNSLELAPDVILRCVDLARSIYA